MADVAVARWEGLTRRVLLLGAGYTVAVAVELAAYVAGRPSWSVLVSLPALVLVIVWSRSYARWRHDSAVLAARAGWVARDWTTAVQRIGVIGLIVAWLVVLPLAALGPVPPVVVVVLTAARVVLCGVLLAAIRVARDRIRAAVGSVGRLFAPARLPRRSAGWGGLTTAGLVAGGLDRLFPDRSGSVPVPVERDGPPAPGWVDGRIADAAFWDEVLALVATTGGPLPVLESWGVAHRRWRLLSPGVTRAGASGGLMAGAVVTVYPDPPSPASEENFLRYAELLRAGPAVGLLEEGGSAAPRFDRLRTEEDLASWRRRATTALRCGVYPAEGVLTATVVTEPAGGS